MRSLPLLPGFAWRNELESKPGPCRRLGRSWCSQFAAWFPGGATISLPCDGSAPAPRRTGLGVLHHPAPSLSLPRWNGVNNRSYPIDSGRLASVLALEAFFCHRAKGARCVITVGSSRCRAVFRLRVLSSRHPFARPALPGVSAPMGGSDFQAPPPVSSLLTLVHGCPPPADRCLDLPGYRILSLSGSIRPQTPGSIRAALATLRHGLLPAKIISLSALPKCLFRGSIPSRSAPPVTFAPRLLSCLRIGVSVTAHAARLDTGLAAHDYPGGTRTR
jgi:hypothetical protein